MKAVYIDSHGDLDVLKYGNVEDPQPNKNQVVVKIKAASINHLDIWVRRGLPRTKTPFPLILGSDASGEIVESNHANYKIGDKVVVQPGTFDLNCSQVLSGNENYSASYGILGETENGVQSDYVALNPINVYPKPEHLSFTESASMQLVFMTAYQMLIKRAQILKGEKILIYGATSGVGSAAIQISKYFGLTVFTTVGDSSKYDYAIKMGADYVYNHSSDEWVSNIKEVLKGQKINVVFEHVGFSTWDKSLKLLAKGGRIVTCGATTGANVEINLAHLFMKQQSILGSTMSSIESFKEVMSLIENKVFFPFVDKSYSFSDIKKAHRTIEDRNQFGKVVLVP